MAVQRWRTVVVLLLAGAVVGAGAIIASTEINRKTGSEAFCTSCHTMAVVAADPHFQQSAHEGNALGVHVTCSDCHSPPGNWFVETYSHASQGIRDVIAEKTHDYSDPAAWQKRRAELAPIVQESMRRDRGLNCRTCHDPSAIKPTSDAGKAAHAKLQDGSATCLDCHMNIVHASTALKASRASPADVATRNQ
jgi:nitrate/TMAO reductase-like tetraheme cytochrome c subunit